MARVHRIANEHGGVAILGKKGIPATKVGEYWCSFCCCTSLETYGLVILYDPPNTNEDRTPDEIVFSCLSSFWAVLRIQIIDQVWFLGNFNLPDENWAHFPVINPRTCTDTTIISIPNSLTQLVTEPTHKDGNVLDFIFSNFDDPEILCIEKHLAFPDHIIISLGLSGNRLTSAINTDCCFFSLIGSDIQTLNFKFSKSLSPLTC